jgi:glutamine synthetase
MDASPGRCDDRLMSSTEDLPSVDTSPEAVRDALRAQGVKYVFGAYVDVHGVPKSKCVPIDHLFDMTQGSERYTVGGLEGMGDLGPNEDECEGIPDLRRITVLPWDPRYALAPADLRFEGAPYSHDSRHVLKTQLAKAAELGYDVNLGVEPEFYILQPAAGGGFEPWAQEDLLNAPTRAYDIQTTMTAHAFLDPMVDYMNLLGWDVYSFDHEGGDSQYEFDFNYANALDMADRMIVFRLMAKHVASTLGCIATFMPKPFAESFGSGAHMNMSLEEADTGLNVFRGEDGVFTEAGRHFTAGILRHAAAITAIACPTVNSYKRLMPVGLMGEISWAPVYIAYGENNRTLMCRLPANRPVIELRIADSACNFYLATAMMLAAGLEGMRLKLDPGEPVNSDTYSIGDEKLAADGVQRLPRNLGEALDALERDELAREVLGEDFHKSFLGIGRNEWEMYSTVIGEWERTQYLHRW